MRYFYTFKLPFKPDLKFDYWAVKDADECLEKAFTKYKTVDFQIEETTRECYNDAVGVVEPKIIKLTKLQVETLRNLIGDPTKFENMTNEEFVTNGLDDIMAQLQFENEE